MKIVTGQEQVLLMATLDFRCHLIHVRLMSRWHWKSRNGAVWSWFTASFHVAFCVPVEALLSRGLVDVEATLSSSPPGHLAMSTTVASSHQMERWSFLACSATTNFSSICLWQPTLCSVCLVSSLLLVSLAWMLDGCPKNQTMPFCNFPWHPLMSLMQIVVTVDVKCSH